MLQGQPGVSVTEHLFAFSSCVWHPVCRTWVPLPAAALRLRSEIRLLPEKKHEELQPSLSVLSQLPLHLVTSESSSWARKLAPLTTALSSPTLLGFPGRFQVWSLSGLTGLGGAPCPHTLGPPESSRRVTHITGSRRPESLASTCKNACSGAESSPLTPGRPCVSSSLKITLTSLGGWFSWDVLTFQFRSHYHLAENFYSSSIKSDSHNSAAEILNRIPFQD